MPSALERLGRDPEDKLLIVNCMDLGFCHAASVGVYEVLRNGIGTSASLVVPAPWARESAGRFRGDDVGVSLTLNAEYDRYRWGPLTQAPSLLDGDGGFPRTVSDLWDHADLDEVRRECRAQLERAVLWGFDVSHLDSRLDALLMRPEFFDIYLELAVDFSLPLGLLGAAAEATVGFPVRRLAAEAGVLFADRFVALPVPATRRSFADLLASLPGGVTELALHPAVDTPELRAITGEWPSRVADYVLAIDRQELAGLAKEAGVTLLGYRPLRDAMRAS
ncbi:MAG TPA: polysaccharide deacetylase family protein [Acidimicrobiales bacterium]|nr:polysaccharide deacetylase family protein [Acidimicrobiales bacterium]